MQKYRCLHLYLVIYVYNNLLFFINAKIPSSNEKNWHLFDDTITNDLIDRTNSSIASSIRRAWNILGEDETKKAYQELFFNYAMDLIYRHQHPSDCSRAKYLISSGYSKGYIHDIHAEGYGLAMALEMNRIYIPSRKYSYSYVYNHEQKIWECIDFYSIDCYYEPWSQCTWKDIDRLLINQQKSYRTIHVSNEQKTKYHETSHLPLSVIDRYKNDQVVGIDIHDRNLPFQRLIPKQFAFIVERNVIPKDRRFYWWRAISASYLLRPNIYMQELLQSYSMPSIADLQGRCVAAFVFHRNQDEQSEDEVEGASIPDQFESHPFHDFADVANRLWDTSYIFDKEILKDKRTLVVGTDLPSILADAISWGKKKRWDVVYNPLIIRYFQENHPNANLSMFTIPAINITTNSSRPLAHVDGPIKKSSHFLEFAYFMVSLVDILRCDNYVCTLAANYCRLIDQLRAMIAMKPEAFYADLSAESCWEPPCIGSSDFRSLGP